MSEGYRIVRASGDDRQRLVADGKQATDGEVDLEANGDVGEQAEHEADAV